MRDLFGNSIKPSAVFSEDREYRYVLTRRWDDRTLCNFIMLNPSTADEIKEDPTVRRCMDFAGNWGYGGLVVTNIFAYRSTFPDDLYKVADPVGPGNDTHILTIAKQAALVVCAWGEHGDYHNRGFVVLGKLRDEGITTKCLGKNASGQPQHPLYIPRDRKLIDM